MSSIGGVVLGLVFTVAGATQATVQTDPSLPLSVSSMPSPEAFALASPDVSREQALDLWATYYYVHGTESTDAGYSLLTPKGHGLGGKVSHKDWCYGALQGTIRVKNEHGHAKVYNYAGRSRTQQVDCSAYFSLPKKILKKVGKVRFGPAIGPFGDGVQGMILVPYRTIAVDQRKIPYGSVVFIPEAKGVKVTLSNGQSFLHDGYFFAADTGSAIKHTHIDVFIGDSGTNPFASFVTSQASGKFKAYVVDSDLLGEQLASIHRSGL
ncbi:MAG: hypothetical protein HOM11_12730 [Methylococcales bacterium]|jgi:3D (Asp-Asp-Asp) domain-containing protein|nr:hypothetical protein [Methylococcales bacterium]MBT7445334.1 hypothetical protein [Methylococcales bacterium]